MSGHNNDLAIHSPKQTINGRWHKNPKSPLTSFPIMKKHYELNGRQPLLDWVVFLIRTPIFERNAAWCNPKNIYQKDTYLKDIGLHAENMISILGSIVNMIR